MKCRTAYCLAILLIALALLVLPGCGLFSRTEAETGAIVGVVAGQPVAVKWTRDSQGQTTIDLPPALLQTIGAVGHAATGDWSNAIILGAGALSSALALYAGKQKGTADVQTARADEHKADADEAWDKLASK